MLDVTISAAGVRIVRLLVGKPPQSVRALMRATGVTRTAVTEQLGDLIAAGLVKRSTERLSGRGRPRHIYEATETALTLLFANHVSVVVPALWCSIREIGGEDLSGKVLKRVSKAAAEHYNARITAKKTRDRVQQLVDLLQGEGSLLEAVEGDNGDACWTLYRRSCPFAGMLDQHRNVCHIDRAILSAAVGRDVRQIACRHDGAPCCAFRISSGAAGHS